ncbi:hypothetical protein H0H81_004542, partial [Sphagnurus paluster]
MVQKAKVQKAKAQKSKAKSPFIQPTTANLIATRDAALCNFGRAPATTEAYSGYLKRTQKFLAALVAHRRANQIIDGLDTNLLAKVFSDTPNKMTVTALGLYISQKCFTEELGLSTASGIQSAFATLYDQQQ